VSLELNKLAAAVLVSGLIAVVVGKTADALYKVDEQPAKRGFQIAAAEIDSGAGVAAAEEKPVDIKPLLATADAKTGEGLVKACAACHDFTNGGANKVGPALWGVVGRKIGSHEGFSYSKAMAGMKDKAWDVQSLSEFLTKPTKYVQGTKMTFSGVKKPEERAAIIAYLSSLK